VPDDFLNFAFCFLNFQSGQPSRLSRQVIISAQPAKASKNRCFNSDSLIYKSISCKRISGTNLVNTRNTDMAKNEFSEYQKAVISGYYNNLDMIMLQKLSELVSDLYLADTLPKQNRLWQRAHKAMVRLKVPPAIIDHIMQKKDVEILAKNLQDWLAYKKK